MAFIRTDDSHYKAIAAKIREKTGSTTTYKPSEMASGIEEVYSAGQNGGGESFVGVLDNTAVNLYSDAKINGLRHYAFYLCSNLESVDLPNLTGAINSNVFGGCTALKSVNFPNASAQIGGSAFVNTQIESLFLPNVTMLYASAFLNMTKLKIAEFSKLQIIYADAFPATASSFESLILRQSRIPQLSTATAFDGGNIAKGTAFVYVPRTSVDSFKSATNWSNYASQIRAIEDYPEITGG